ncbi:Asp-tRNA(Asn)/Glu-tRNA(Gln) amidotransferase subunit GatB [Patescibacteria group bacterium]|nr:Asp-tRNA(Asn)/Glu-tRNA(Gln) amidotransferase subunit GatB [Patescibacteria group bacterium]
MSTEYQLVCGMEVHAELKTASKMFCGCKNDPFHAEKPNTHTCPVCLGMPGGLPVANRTAIEWTIKLGLALNCKINLFSHFDRKNYFYPDLPKGYQISQYDQPFCYDGVLETDAGAVRIRRIHLEEDTAKLLHKTVDGKKVSLVDFNRSSVPLIEIVTEPDIISPEHAKAYGKTLRQIMRFLDIADCDMEQGGMRLEANVSIRPVGQTALPNYKVELKNINSFRFLEKAVAYEMERQACELNEGKTPIQETRGWNDNKGETFSQRVKEDAEDYRYFPDPDLPPLRFTAEQIEQWRAELPELPAALKQRWQEIYGIDTKYADVLSEEKESASWADQLFAAAQKAQLNPNAVANAVVNKKVTAAVGDSVQQVLVAFTALHQTASVDEAELQHAIDAVIAENGDAAAQYKAGKVQILGFFMGQVQRKLGKKLDAQLVKTALEKSLS